MFGFKKKPPRPVIDPAFAQPVAMTGTTTMNAVAAQALWRSRPDHSSPMWVGAGQFVPEPDNPADANAVAVHVHGERVGYLPGYLARQWPLARQKSQTMPCQVQIWGSEDRVIGWAAAGDPGIPVNWPHTPDNPPAMTAKQRAAARSAAVSDMVHEAINGNDPARKAQFERGMVGGYHYLETIEPIAELKRQKRYDEALVLCYGAIAAAEADAASEGRQPAPAYTEQAAIIHRKLGQRDEEIAVLQRWLAACPPQFRDGSKIQQRLNKLTPPGALPGS